MLISKILPWVVAKAALKPQVGDDIDAKRLDRLGFWRSLVGFVTVFCISLDYRSAEDLAVNEPGSKLAMNVGLGVGAVIFLLPFTYFITQHPFRGELVRGIRRFLKKILIAVLTIGLPLGYIFYANHLRSEGRYFYDKMSPLLVLPIASIQVVLGVWFFGYFACVLYWWARTCFWIGEAHPMLAPIGSALVVLVLTVSDLIEMDSRGLPIGLWLLIILSGTGTSLVLATAEYRHLKNSGIALRTGPHHQTVRRRRPARSQLPPRSNTDQAIW